MGVLEQAAQTHADARMTDPDRQEFFERLQADPAVCSCQACIKGARIPVSLILDMLAGGDTIEDLLSGHPTLSGEDVAASAYGAWLAGERILPLARSS